MSFKTFLWGIGFYWTIHAGIQDYQNYRSFPSNVIEKKLRTDEALIFPKIFVCSQSQHSLRKLNQYYPGIPKDWIRTREKYIFNTNCDYVK